MIKSFLDSRDVQYVLRDVISDEAAAREFLTLGGRLPPLLRIGDRVIEGYRPDEIDDALAEFPRGIAGGNEEESNGPES